MQTEQDLDPLLANQQNQLDLIFGEGDSIDSKALAILGANVAIIIFVNQTAHGLALWEYLALYAPFGLSLLLNLFSIWPRRYLYAGVATDRLTDYINMDRDELLLQLLSTTQAAIEHNSRLNNLRMRAALVSIGITGLGFLLLLGIL
ncbi:MAG TPA: hypothetical protein VLF71_01960 [Candidatus Saccharimonadales bacterium]|nr:hypothetical protein [Candidatus Saccharimonadales bacterium]